MDSDIWLHHHLNLTTSIMIIYLIIEMLYKFIITNSENTYILNVIIKLEYVV